MDKDIITIPLVALQDAMYAAERHNKRLIAVIIILIVALVASNLFWVYEWTQYDYVADDYSIDAEQDGDYNIVGAGDIEYVADSTSTQTENIENTQ